MKIMIILLSLVFLFMSCNDNKANESLTKEQLHKLAIEIQKDFAHMNMQMGDISEEKLENMNEKISYLAEEVKTIREELPKNEISAEVLQTSHKLYSEMLVIYDEAGFKTDKIKEKIDKLGTGVKNL